MRDISYYKFIVKYSDLLIHIGKDMAKLMSKEMKDSKWLSMRKNEYLHKLEDFVNDKEIYDQYEDFIVERMVLLGDTFYSQINKFFNLVNDKNGTHYEYINKYVTCEGELGEIIKKTEHAIEWYSHGMDMNCSFCRFLEDEGREIKNNVEFYAALLLRELEEAYELFSNPSMMPDYYLEISEEYMLLLKASIEHGVEFVVRNDSNDIICEEKKVGLCNYYSCVSTSSEEHMKVIKNSKTNKSEITGICLKDKKEVNKENKILDKLMDEVLDGETKKGKFIRRIKLIWKYITMPFIFIFEHIHDFFKYKEWKYLFKKKSKKKKEKKPKVKKEKVIKEKIKKEKIKKVRKEKISKPRKTFNFKIKLPKIKLDIGNLKDLLILVIPLVMILLVPSGAFLKIIEIIIEVGNAIMTKCYSEFFITKLIFSMPGFEGFLVIFSFLLKLVFGVVFAIVEFVLMVVSFILLFVLGLGLNILALIIQFAIPILIVLYIVLMIIRMVKKGYKWSDIIVSLLVLGLLVFLCFVFFILYKESVLANK